MNIDNIKRWYSGKALKVITDMVIPTLLRAAELGYWPKGVSRSVKAALNKQSVAEKFARGQDRDWNVVRDQQLTGKLFDLCDNRGARYKATLKGSNFIHAMMFGQYGHAPELVTLAEALLPHCANDDERVYLATARKWAEDFAPVAALIETLDASRPIPTYVFKTLSPTVLANVGVVMAVDVASVTSPPMEWVRRAGKTPEGQTYYYHAPVIRWPADTRHNTSRFALSDHQCHACGHAIRNAFNWVPLLATSEQGPVSLWVGRDCAKKLFGCDVTGDAEFNKGAK